MDVLRPNGSTGGLVLADGSEDAALSLVRTLCAALSSDGIAYCHWKSNEALDRSASGDNDLDLLVSRTDARGFEAILGRLGFKNARPPANKEMPGVFHAYGLDAPSGKLVHIHAHYQLVLGDDMTKNYRLPLEEAYLASSEQGAIFRIPAPEFEFVVFVLRMILKHSTLDAVVSHQGSLSPSEARELAYLRVRTDPARATDLVLEHLPFVGRAVWERCARCLEPGASHRVRIATAHRLERALAAHARRMPLVDAPLRLWRRGRVILRRRVLHRPAPRSRLEGGGSLIALVGGDGAGKSTAVNELYRWLSKEFAVTEVHLGKPRRSLTTSLVQRLWKGSVRRGSRGATVADLAGSQSTSMSGRAYVKLVQHAMIARDRALTYERARRAVSAGGIVIADRFPLPGVTLMDSPVAPRLLGTRRPSRVASSLARLERRYYGRIGRPDILIVLRVAADVAVERRRGTDEEAVVRLRSEEISRLDWSGSGAVLVDADRPKDDVLNEIKSAVWTRL
jgi:thymidylate kinase